MAKNKLIGLTMFLVSFVAAHEDEIEGHHSSMMDGFWFGSVFGWLIMALIVVGLVLLIIWLVKELGRKK